MKVLMVTMTMIITKNHNDEYDGAACVDGVTDDQE